MEVRVDFGWGKSLKQDEGFGWSFCESRNPVEGYVGTRRSQELAQNWAEDTWTERLSQLTFWDEEPRLLPWNSKGLDVYERRFHSALPALSAPAELHSFPPTPGDA